MKRLSLLVILVATLLVALLAAPAVAVNDPLVPADECSASDVAAGHPAFANQPPQGANPPFSANNPGVSTGAKGQAMSQALEHCKNATG